MDVAASNIQDGIGVANIQDGALGTMQDSLQRIRELSIKASNGLYGDSEKQMIQGEIDQLLQDIEQTAVGTQYNEKHLLDPDGECHAESPGPGRLQRYGQL